jgi:glycine cleavage system H lipoate-binding protein
MENFSFIDIFSTKGIEYIFVIGFLILLVLFLIYMDRPGQAARKLTARATAAPTHWFRIIQGLFYHQGHSWAMPEGQDLVRVGMDDFAQMMVGNPDSITLPDVGSIIEQGENAWQLEIDSKSIGMISPISGEVIEVNREILKSPGQINKDPYSGWLLKVKAPSMKRDMKNLLSGNLAVSWMEHAVKSLQERMSGELGTVMQDGGTLISGFAKQLSPEDWDKIASEYLMNE